jgi:hypothetical protein
MNISRPIKRGNMRRYTDVLSVLAPSDVTVDAAEMDGDLDTLYGHQIGTADLVDGSITTAKLAVGAVTAAKLAADAAPQWSAVGTTAMRPFDPARSDIQIPVDGGTLYFGSSPFTGIRGSTQSLDLRSGTQGTAWYDNSAANVIMHLAPGGSLWLPNTGSLFFGAPGGSALCGMWGDLTTLGLNAGAGGFQFSDATNGQVLLQINLGGSVWLRGTPAGSLFFGPATGEPTVNGIWGDATTLGLDCGTGGVQISDHVHGNTLVQINIDGSVWLQSGSLYFGQPGQTANAGIWGSPTAFGLDSGMDGYEFSNHVTAQSVATISGVGDLRIWGANATKASGTAWINPSDRRLKTDIAPYRAGLAELSRLEPLTYHLKSSPTGPLCYGFDAEAVQAVLPECVGTIQVDGEAMLTLDMSPMIIAMVGALKELGDRVAAIEEAGT